MHHDFNACRARRSREAIFTVGDHNADHLDAVTAHHVQRLDAEMARAGKSDLHEVTAPRR